MKLFVLAIHLSLLAQESFAVSPPSQLCNDPEPIEDESPLSILYNNQNELFQEKPNLRSRQLDETGGCGNNKRCFERYEQGSRYQAYSDGFCNRHDLCGGSYPNTQCFCQSENYQPPPKPYLFEQSSDYSRISSSFPYVFPSFQIQNFADGPTTQVYNIVNDTLPYDGITPPDAVTLAEYDFSLQDTFIQGRMSVKEEIEPVPIGFGSRTLFTDLLFGFRVLESGSYRFRVNFINDVYNINAFRFKVEYRDYLPDLDTDQIVSTQLSSSTGDTVSEEFTLEVGFNFLLTVFGYTSGEADSTVTSWTLEKV